MKHIKELLAMREKTLFAQRSGKGSAEWSTFNAIRGDQIEMFPVSTPQVQSTIRYPNIVHITRLPRQLRARAMR